MKKYREWISENERVDRRELLTQEQLDWCEKHISLDWWVNEKGEVEVELHLIIDYKHKDEIKEFPVQFADVRGSFECSNSINLTSLKGSPRKVGRNFRCESCKSLNSLEGAPEEVGGNFYCYNCDSLTSLEGAPQKVGEDFHCGSCENLTSLEGAPVEVGGDFYCSGCASLTSLEGLPKKFVDLIARNCDSLPDVEYDFAEDEEFQEQWKKSPLDWKKFMYGSAAKGRKFGL